MNGPWMRMLDYVRDAVQESPLVLGALLVAEVLLVGFSVFLLVRYARFLGYVVRNARRNLLRSILTIASIAVSLFLMMMLMSLLTVMGESATSLRDGNRLITISSQGFTQPVPIALVNQVRALDGVQAASPMNWYGGKYLEEVMPFAQFGVDADTIMQVYAEFRTPPEQLKAFQDDRSGCLIGTKLAQDRKIKIGDTLPLKGTIYPFDLNLTVRGIYDGPSNRDLRIVFFHWVYLDEGLKREFRGKMAGNAGALIIKCQQAGLMNALAKKIDDMTLNSDNPTRTQTEEAFTKIFLEMYGDVRGLIRNVGLAVVFSLICVAGNAMAMSLRERTTEVAVLKAIGFSRALVICLVLFEAILVAGLGGLIGALGTKLLFDVVDISRYTSQFVAFFYVPWPTALLGLGVALLVGFVSGLFPAVRAARLSVIDGLRKVV